MKLEEIFSEKNVLDYSNVCIDLSVEMPDAQKKWGFDTLVIPSRGAVPFFLGMLYSLGKLQNSFGGEHEEFYNGIRIQRMTSELFPKNLEESILDEKPTKVLLIPFTADLNISKFDSRLDDDEFTLKTRRYWSNVTRSFFLPPRERRKDPYFLSFVDIVLRDIEGRDQLAEAYESFPKINNFSLIDTVISGRAATQILGAFEGLAVKYQTPELNPSSFLIIDEDGHKLRPEYARYLTRRRLEGILKEYRAPRIVSEDEGASLLGVGAAIYPSVMKISREFEVGGEEFFIGAGGWHNSADIEGPYFGNFLSFMNMIYKGIDLVYSNKFIRKENSKEEFEESRKSFLERANKYRILDRTSEDISLLNPSRNYSYGPCYETRSHVLHAPFKKSSEERLRSKISSIPGVRVIGN